MKIPLCLAALLFAVPALAHDYRLGTLHIVHPHARATPPGASTGAVVMSIENSGAADDVFLGASSPLAATVEIHNSAMVGGMMQMRPLADGVRLPAGGTVDLEALGDHLMLIGLSAPLAPGVPVPVTLHFQKAGDLLVDIHIDTLDGGSEPAHPH